MRALSLKRLRVFYPRNHEQTEQRLLQLFALDEKELFRSPDQLVAEAYKKQGEKVAYHEEDLVLREEPPRYGN